MPSPGSPDTPQTWGIRDLKRLEHQADYSGSIEDAARYAREMKRFARLFYHSTFKHIMELDITGRYLEASSGPGILAAMIAGAKPSTRIVCVDVSQEMVEVGSQYIEEQGLADRVEFVVTDVSEEAAMSALGEFDLVYSTYSMHHWEDLKQALRNLWLCVKPGGSLYLSDLRRVSWIRFIPFGGGLIDSIKASLTPPELEAIADEVHLINYTVASRFPCMLSLTAHKAP